MDIKITKKQKIGIIAFLLIMLLISSIVYFRNKTEIPEDKLKKNGVLVEENRGNIPLNSNENILAKSQGIKAYICGYVERPGVYTLNQGDRLDDLVRLAGGFNKEAEPKGVNLACIVKDQDYFRIPSINEAKENITMIGQEIGNKTSTSVNNKEDSEKQDKININTATQEALKDLPRIGDAMSKRIIDYREKEGGFKTIDDIKEVTGIGDKMFENIKDKITVE